MAAISFKSSSVALDDRRIAYIVSEPPATAVKATPVIAIHGLGGNSSFWLPALAASGLGAHRTLYAYDFDGHGESDWSGRQLSIDDLVADLEAVLDILGLRRVVLVGHSMNGTVTSLFAQRRPERVEKLILLHPVRNMPPAAQEGMRARAAAAGSTEGLSGIANTVCTAAVSAVSRQDLAVRTLIRHCVATTKPAAYAAACLALASAPHVDAAKTGVPVHIIGGEEDYLAGPAAVEAWAKEAGGTSKVLHNVGHWGAIEAPEAVGRELTWALAPETYNLILGTFRSPYLYSLSFNTRSRRLELTATTQAVGGHSWLDVSPDGKTLYCTVWGEPPRVASYVLNDDGVPSSPSVAPLKYLSGYVCSNAKAVYSAAGPQVDVFLLNAAGQVSEAAVQSFSLVAEADQHKGTAELDFGGLRHGGHSADLSPDGSKLYVADIGRNCVWVYNVDAATGLLTEASKNVATRPDDGPRHAWPHPNGKIVYSLQEHSSYVDAFELDGAELRFLGGGRILPPGEDAKEYWADEVRLSPDNGWVFGSVRGLTPEKKGYVAAWRLRPDGRLERPGDDTADHRFQTATSGGWANAIAVCPNAGLNGEVWLTLTDSEEGFIQMLEFSEPCGFKVVDEVRLGSKEEHVGASIAVWL
ncbi:hypothetical protein VHUM_03635 [Vanrija humicola]|uniref:AB hydrolase-1 domain-containing protein n=1 Tax=Vanrija humicola TaxID=5417 RepID=A0A7D8YX24_VANHU|nr:hypothetical protein VHUM_03635 [Vanrija humicola]